MREEIEKKNAWRWIEEVESEREMDREGEVEDRHSVQNERICQLDYERGDVVGKMYATDADGQGKPAC